MIKLLAANRSEIAVRIFRSATELGYRTVAVYAEEDRFSVHRFKADEAYLIGKGDGPVAAYLDIGGILSLAKDKGVKFIHPGYGFLAENAAFAKGCEREGIIFVGPRSEVLELMGNKTVARRLAKEAGLPTVPGTESAVSDREEALRAARKIGFPLIIKAAFGGGGRGMRIVKSPNRLPELLEEAQGEAERAFGNSAVFLERYIAHPKHLEVQILGDRHGNVVHLHERDCSVQRRHQKVVEIAPAVAVNRSIIKALCEASVLLARHIAYDNAGTVEYLLDMETGEWFFMEMNPRIQVEHTVTEMITGIDLVRSQILLAKGERLHGRAVEIPPQQDIPRNGCAVQCRITTEDPEKDFTPDYGKIVNYRSAAGFGVRLDGAMGDTGSVITPFYDSMLVKLTAFGPSFPGALRRMDRALREFRIRGVKVNIPFLLNVVNNPVFASGKATTALIDTTPELFRFKPLRDRANKLLAFLGDIIVNGNEQVRGRPVPRMELPLLSPGYEQKKKPPRGTRDRLHELGPEKFCQWVRKQRALLITDTTFRDAHQSLLAARMRSFDMLGCADAIARRAPELFSLEMWGGATFDTALRFLHESPFERLRKLREKIPNILFQMLLRGSNGVGYANYPDNVIRGFVKHSAEAGIDVFRIFDSLNYVPNLKVAMETVRKTGAICEAAICYTGDILDPSREKYSLAYYVALARKLEEMGAHILAIKDMAGLCKPYAAEKLVKTLKEEIGLPVHFHTHDSSGIASASIFKASEAGVDIVDCAISSMSGLTSQPNLNSVVSGLDNNPRNTRLDLDFLNELTLYWEAVRQYYEPVDTSPKFGSADVYAHEMPGGQYTNLREQAVGMGLGNRWLEVVRYYREVNRLFGDLVKVTPSSKVVGDMAMFLLSRGIEPSDVLNLEPGSTPFPASVLDMLAGGLGQPMGGWPRKIQKIVLGKRKPRRGRPGRYAEPIDLKVERESLKELLKGTGSEDALYMHLMYPDVYKKFVGFNRRFSDVSVLPTPAFFYGLKAGEEIGVDIEEGKRLYIKLINVGEPDDDGYRSITFELNGRPRESRVLDKSVSVERKPREKADPSDPRQVGAPIPGVISSLNVSVGQKVSEGEKLCVLEAMKMQTTLYAQAPGVVDALHVQFGDSVESKDLILRLR